MLLFIFFTIMILIALFQIPRLLKKKYHKELIAFIVLWIIATIYATLNILELPVLNPIELITETMSRFPFTFP